jgi:hypothetical protein
MDEIFSISPGYRSHKTSNTHQRERSRAIAAARTIASRDG